MGYLNLVGPAFADEVAKIAAVKVAFPVLPQVPAGTAPQQQSQQPQRALSAVLTGPGSGPSNLQGSGMQAVSAAKSRGAIGSTGGSTGGSSGSSPAGSSTGSSSGSSTGGSSAGGATSVDSTSASPGPQAVQSGSPAPQATKAASVFDPKYGEFNPPNNKKTRSKPSDVPTREDMASSPATVVRFRSLEQLP